ncbi:reticulon-like protein B14 [Corylus avellana]|uniref:reticulon-like protein B14 n=1 Tax=Corylus avellana TaxID=13451 RepID=UPI00286C7F21|nr:reticulon-like protein B14 [Corylus avellana]
MSKHSSYSDDQGQSFGRLFGRERSLHNILGGGKVADILLWKNTKLSAAILAGFTTIWLLFEVAEYQLVTLLCHLLIITMLIIFIWSKAAGLIDRSPPNIQEIRLSESTCRHLFTNVNWFLFKFYEISSGKDLKHFFLAVSCLWMLSVAGTYFSSLNLSYIAFLCIQTLPVLYERYEKEVDYLATKGNQDVKKWYRKFDSNVLNKIPRGPVKEKKFK